MLAALKLCKMKYSNMRNWFNYRGSTSETVAKFIYAMRGMLQAEVVTFHTCYKAW
jgi:hypothetical protein